MGNNGLIFKTKRLYVRKLTPCDLPAYAALEANTAVMRYITGRPRTLTESKKRFAGFLRSYATNAPFTGVWGIFEQGTTQYIGTASLNQLPNSHFYQIGYKLHPSAQGKGYATEIAQNLLRLGFGRAHLQKLTAVTDPDNKASQRVLQKAGMPKRTFHQAYGANLTFFTLEKEQYVERLRKRG